MNKITCCPVCGGQTFSNQSVLWPELIEDWQLSPHEAAYIDRQQGFSCTSCGNNLRSMALADAIMNSYQFAGTLNEFVKSNLAENLNVLEINEAGGLSVTLAKLPNYKLIRYPEHDMTKLIFEAGSFDLVIHSDTLEHVPNPIDGLMECRRVLKHKGRCIFTAPIVVGRMTRSRDGLKKSYHGDPRQNPRDYMVHTEFGADVWRYAAEAGFSSIKIHNFEYPAGLAIVALAMNENEIKLQSLPWTGERYLTEVKGDIELEHLHRYLLAKQLTLGKRVLDIASGEGYGTALLAQSASSVVGVDISSEAVAHSSAKYQADNLEYKLGSCAAIPLDNNCVDVVVSFETIEHHHEHEEMMREIKRVLVPGGMLIISCPDKLEYSDLPSYNNPYHVKELYRGEFELLLENNFKHRRMAGQRIVYGSVIFNEDGLSKLTSYDIKDQSLSRISGVPRALYLVAIASDSELSLIESGLLEQSIVESDALRGRDWQIANLTHALANLTHAVAERDGQIAALIASKSWQLTKPLRYISRLLRN